MENVNYDTWSKLDLRVAQIKNVEEIPNADKLYKLTIDLGTEKRILVAGIKKHYSKEQLIDKKCIVFCNLEPRKLKGIESQGMILCAVNEDESKIILLAPESDIELGSKIR